MVVRRNLTLLIICSAFALAPAAQAGVWIQTAFTVTQFTDDSSGSDTSDVRLLNSTSAGYSFLQGFVIAGQALWTRSSMTGNHTFAWGPKAGLLIKGFEASAAYLPLATDSIGGSSRTGGGFAF